ncbi:hypothetical protein, partial [Sansalvadorimonas verongulae]|uniref:hypothetical protein n=1 Tax=Sansalvadorimonas verongulae TaxID=2172824 RepID=UPI001E569EFC
LDERFQFLKSTGENFLKNSLDDETSIRMLLDVDTTRSPRKEQFQKLKIDALNDLTGRHYEMVE